MEFQLVNHLINMTMIQALLQNILKYENNDSQNKFIHFIK
jgi:hypothetical protein